MLSKLLNMFDWKENTAQEMGRRIMLYWGIAHTLQMSHMMICKGVWVN